MIGSHRSRDELRCRYEARLSLLADLAGALQRKTEAALSDIEHIDQIVFRVKSTDSFVKKALSTNHGSPFEDPLADIDDQVAGRIVVFSLRDLQVVRRRLTKTFTAVESSFRHPKKDEEFGYESHHLICEIPHSAKPREWDNHQDLPKTFEFQLRTLFMHAWAEQQHELAYKRSGSLPHRIRKILAWTAASAWGADQAMVAAWEWENRRKV